MKINEPKIAAQSYADVRDTCITKVNVPADRIELDTDFSRSGWHFGSEILPSNRKSDLSSYLGRLQKLIVPRQGESVCWLGYQKGALKHAERAVWFYCGTASEMKAVRTAFLKKWAAPQDVSFEKGDNEMARYFKVTSQAGSGDPDRKWFCSKLFRLT